MTGKSVCSPQATGLRAALPVRGWGRAVKRGMDVSVGLLLGIVFAPLMLVIACLIWATSGLPILFSQPRVGLGGKVFYLYKFRSMIPGAAADPAGIWTRRNDPRRTPLGTWLRRLGLDELPQLYNIVRGEMSLVGPRPERVELVAVFCTRFAQYDRRHSVLGGLTGWAQIHGLRGDTSLERRLAHDLYYIDNWSVWLDLKILVLTLFRGWSNAG